MDQQTIQVLLDIKEDTGYMRGKMESFDSRITALEDHKRAEGWKSWIATAVLAPFLYALKPAWLWAAKKLGV